MSWSARKVWICLGLALLTLTAYWPVLHHDFVNYDDPSYVTENPHIQQGMTWKAVGWAFGAGYAANWHPITWLSHMLDCQLYGLRPSGHHLSSLLLHTANTVLLFLCFCTLTGTLWRSAFVAALFGLHPFHVESVAWIAERKDVLSTLFGLLAIWAYAKYVDSGKEKAESRKQKADITLHALRFNALTYYFLSLFLFALSLMSKPMLVTLPFLLLLLDYWPLRRFGGLSESRPASGKTAVRLLCEKWPFFLLAVGSSVVTFLVQERAGAVPSTETLPLGTRLSHMPLAYAAYVGKALWPVRLSVFYPYPLNQPLGLAALAGVALAGITAAAIYWRRQWPQLIVGWLWFLGTLIPVIGVVQVGAQFIADRYSYFPLVGLFLLVAWCPWGASGDSSGRRRVMAGAGALVIILCLGCTRAQVRHWRNSETLFRHALAVSSRNFVAHANLGKALADRGALREAEAEFASVLRIYPSNYPSIYALGNLVLTNGDHAAALDLFNRALQTRPQDATAHYNHGIALAALGQGEAAIAQYREALRLDPSLVQAHDNLAGLLIAHGQIEEGLSEAQAALRLDPDSAQAHLKAGHALFLEDKFPEAEAHYQAAARLRPDSAEARLALGTTLANQGKLQAAIAPLIAAARLKPNDAEPHEILARLYVATKRAREASAEFALALRLDPDWLEGMTGLAWILATHPDPKLRDGTQAVQLSARAAALTGGTNLSVQGTLAAAYAEAGMFTQASELQEFVCYAARAQERHDEEAAARQRLELYRAGRPYRQP